MLKDRLGSEAEIQTERLPPRTRLTPSQVTSTCDADCHWLACGRVIESTFEPAFGSQNPAHASMSFRRFAKASPRRYARSVPSPATWASAASASSRGKLVASPHQSRKAERKP